VIEPRLYPASVFWSDEDEGFIAVAPDLPGCSAFGSTHEEAVRELQSAIAAWVAAAEAAGNAVPHPSKPALDADVSGKYLLRMPKSLHYGLAQAAKREGVSLNQHMVFLLTQGLYGNGASYQTHAATLGVSGNGPLGTIIAYSGNSLPYRSGSKVVVGTFLGTVPAREFINSADYKVIQISTPLEVAYGSDRQH